MRILLLLFAAAILSLARSAPCTSADVGRTYTPCLNGTRVAIYFFKNVCEPDSYQLPEPVYGIPCSIECGIGEHLPFGSQNNSSCTECDPGTFSPGGELYNSWETMPEGFRTDCTQDNQGNCSTWVLKGDYIDSGDNYNYMDIDTHLRMNAEFQRESGNKIRFLYRVDAENCGSCDGLKFYIDDEVAMPLVSQQLRWTLFEKEVSKGFHDFRWTFTKDFSISQGSDKASIMMIETVGTYKYIEECLKCPSGTYSQEYKSSECTKCDYNTYNPDTGKSSCSQCSLGYASFEGSTGCTALPPCTDTMYFGTRTDCDANTKKQDLIYQFFTMGNGKVKVCNENLSSSAKLPSPILGVACICPPGQYLDNNGKCVFCPTGEARGVNDNQCKKCAGGTAAIKTLFYGEWSKIPEEVDTFCEGNCDSAGWVPRGTHIDAGYGSIKEMEAVMSIKNIVYETEGYLEFQYTLIDCDNCKMELSIDGTLEDAIFVKLNSTSGYPEIVNMPISPGNYTFTFRYYQLKVPETQRGGKAKIVRISFVGVAKGGAIECTPCPAGYDSSDDGSNECLPCPKGSYSSEKGERCKLADDGYYVDTVGAVAQKPCGEGTKSFANRTGCFTDCTFSLSVSASKKIVYDLNPLYSPEKMHFAGTDETNSHVFFINMCSREHSNTTCFDDKGKPLPTFGCQTIKTWGFAVDIGNVIGFHSLPDHPTSGLVVTFSDGTPGCEKFYGTPTPRRTNVTLICDPDAGLGSPSAPSEYPIEYPPKSCIYNFEWKTQHACPICNEDDFKLSSSECIDNKKVISRVRISQCYDKNPIPPVIADCITCPSVEGAGICNSHGSCDDEVGKCHCDTRWSGDLCDKCALGFFGEQCLQDCPGVASNNICNGHGFCNYGLNGNGTCTCSTGWTGVECNTCDEGFIGEDCVAKPATVTDVVPWWGFVLIFGSLLVIGLGLIALWRSKRHAEYKYTSLLKSQPVELEGDDHGIGLPLDEEEEDQARN